MLCLMLSACVAGRETDMQFLSKTSEWIIQVFVGSDLPTCLHTLIIYLHAWHWEHTNVSHIPALNSLQSKGQKNASKKK